MNANHTWFGDVPLDWNIKKIKQATRLRNEKANEVTDEVYLGLENIEPYTGKYYVNNKEEQNVEGISNRFYKGDVLFGKLRPYLTKCVESDFNGICTTELLVIKCEEETINSAYLKYLLLSPKFIDEVNSSTYGTKMPRANWEFIKNIEIPLPNLKTQGKITKYIQDKKQSIESVIKGKEKVIRLLEEKRQSIITEAVTKGLNPNVKMKDSGVEWIGEIPEHWEMKKIKHLVTLKNKNADENAELTYVGLENIESKTGKYLKSEIVEIESTAIKFQKGDVLFGKLRPYLTKVLLADFDGICTTEILVFETINEIYSNKFLKYQLLSPLFIDEVNSSTYGTKMPRANWNFIGNIFIPVLPMEEQQQIANYLELTEVEIDRLVIRIKSQIKKLKEYRQSLIYETVTGKIDVRELIAEK